MDYDDIFDTNTENTWCPGCGNFGILRALKTTLTRLHLRPQDVLIVSGIGQAAKTPHYIHANGINGLHGRALPNAFGAKVANKHLKVIITSGDGDTYGEGGNHFVHNIRRNIDVTHLIHDNQIYGLTKGQGSPTTAMGQRTTMQFEGIKTDPLNPLAFAISLGCSFVARAFSGDIPHLISIMEEAMKHRGYAMIDILQPCVTFNKVNTYKWYKDRTYYLDQAYNPYDKVQAFTKALEWDDSIPLGIIYREDKVPFIDRFPHLKEGPALVDKNHDPSKIRTFLKDFE